MSLGSQLRKYRNAGKLTLQDLADRSGVERGTIGALEIRSSKRSEFWIPLAASLGLTLEQLADEEADHTDAVRLHLKLYPLNHGTVTHLASDKDRSEWKGDWWPFSLPKERMRAILTHEDLERIDAYVAGIVQLRESELLKNSA